jgi:hypothetical protein
METNNNSTKSFSIPMDVLMDTLKIFLNNDIEYKIEGISEKSNSVIIQMKLQKNSLIYTEAVENIETILEDYNYYVDGDIEKF